MWTIPKEKENMKRNKYEENPESKREHGKK